MAAPYSNRALAWRSKGEFDRALDDANEALRRDPKNPAIFSTRGDVNVPMNPEHDAAVIAASLCAVGFESVTLIDDATRDKMIGALRAFREAGEPG